jgi:lipoprotein-anchoring transpeptidase ErfK/SrfK
MVHKVLAAALAASLVLIAIPNFAVAASKADTVLVLKKKKLAAEVRALEIKKAALTEKIAAKKSPAQIVHLDPCGSFLQCLFGRRHRQANTQSNGQVQLASATGSSISGKTTNRVVAWNEPKYPAGSLIVRTPERALYYVSGEGEAIRYSIGVGREGMQWSGNSKIVAKAEWPSWTPPQEMIKREAEKGHMLPPFMEGGPGNPLGARALYIGGRIYRVHGTNNEASIGGAVSSGCIRMMNADVIDLYDRVKVGAKIYVYQ